MNGTTLLCSENPCAGCEHCNPPEPDVRLRWSLGLELADYIRLHHLAFRHGRQIETVETDYL